MTAIYKKGHGLRWSIHCVQTLHQQSSSLYQALSQYCEIVLENRRQRGVHSKVTVATSLVSVFCCVKRSVVTHRLLALMQPHMPCSTERMSATLQRLYLTSCTLHVDKQLV